MIERESELSVESAVDFTAFVRVYREIQSQLKEIQKRYIECRTSLGQAQEIVNQQASQIRDLHRQIKVMGQEKEAAEQDRQKKVVLENQIDQLQRDQEGLRKLLNDRRLERHELLKSNEFQSARIQQLEALLSQQGEESSRLADQLKAQQRELHDCLHKERELHAQELLKIQEVHQLEVQNLKRELVLKSEGLREEWAAKYDRLKEYYQEQVRLRVENEAIQKENFKVRLQDALNQTQSELQETIKGLQGRIALIENQKNSQKELYETQIVNMQKEILSFQELLQNEKEQKEKMQSLLEKSTQDTAYRESNHLDLQEKMKELHQKCVQLEENLQIVNAEKMRMSQNHESEVRVLNEQLELERKVLHDKVEFERKELLKVKHFLDLEVDEKTKLADERIRLLGQLAEMDKSLQSRDLEIIQARKEIQGLHQTHQEIKQQAQAEILGLQKKIEKIESEFLDEKAVASTAQVRAEALKAEILSLKKDLQAAPTTEEMTRLIEDLARMQKTIETKERQVKSYLQHLNQNKETFKEAVVSFYYEMKVTQDFHPIQDLLTTTERELTKFEMGLKKLPASDPGRPQAEKLYSDTVQQREFLRELLRSSKQEHASRLLKIEKLIESGLLEMLPPPFNVQLSFEAKDVVSKVLDVKKRMVPQTLV